MDVILKPNKPNTTVIANNTDYENKITNLPMIPIPTNSKTNSINNYQEKIIKLRINIWKTLQKEIYDS